MDSARQVVRWTIPGAVFIASALSFELVVVAVLGMPPDGYSGGDLGDVPAGTVVAWVIFGAVALGYIVFQIYYFLYGQAVYPVLGVARADRGREILKHLAKGQNLHEDATPEDEELLRDQIGDLTGAVTDFDTHLVQRDSWPKYFKLSDTITSTRGDVLSRGSRRDRAKAYRAARDVNWDAVKALVDLTSDDGDSSIRAEYTSLSDIYHSLGASIVASAGALVGFTILNLAAYPERWDSLRASLAAAAAVATVFGALCLVFMWNRQATYRGASNCLSFGLRARLLRRGMIETSRDLKSPYLIKEDQASTTSS